MSNNKPKVAVVGLGSVGKVIASNLVKGNREVLVAGRKIEDSNTFASALGRLAKPADVKSAIQEADIIVMSVWFSTIKELFKQYASELRGKIIIDPSNPIAPDGNGGFEKVIGAEQSGGLILKGLLPKGAILVKALGTLGAASLSEAAFKKPNHVLFYASDDDVVKGTVEELITDSGFEPIDVGQLDQSIRIEVFGELHEFGALGKTVTRSEFELKA